jgi:hypothetical protein
MNARAGWTDGYRTVVGGTEELVAKPTYRARADAFEKPSARQIGRMGVIVVGFVPACHCFGG